jgi:hypothetical protein
MKQNGSKPTERKKLRYFESVGRLQGNGIIISKKLMRYLEERYKFL